MSEFLLICGICGEGVGGLVWSKDTLMSQEDVRMTEEDMGKPEEDMLKPKKA